MTTFATLQQTDRLYLTDGGLETWLFFQQGFEAPEFAAIVLTGEERATDAMRRYFDGFLALAEEAGTGFVLDTNTWRGCVGWAEKLGLSEDELLALSRKSVVLSRSIRDAWQSRVPEIVLNGVVGPAGDGYAPGKIPNIEEARAIHAPQIRVLAESGVDMISAITITNVEEASGIALEVRETGLPVVISFTVETDGHLPAGVSLGDAIESVDRQTGSAPAYYMVNCAHPDHFRGAIATGERWVERIGGVRANASRLSHAELDEAEELDQGDPEEFGHLHLALSELLPNLRVLGGCCGTDHRHVACVSHNVLIRCLA